MPLLDIRDLHVEFPTQGGTLHAVDGVSLRLEQGEVLGIVGESGSGKSVTMMALMGLIGWPGRVRAQHLRFAGHDLLGIADKERRSLVSLGRLYHFGYALKARLALLWPMLLGLLFRRNARVVPLRRDPTLVTMADPHAEAYSNPAIDQADEIEEEEAEEEEEAPKARPKPADIKPCRAPRR